ncbi:hypothetical protein X777_03041 [Ooceraea biroi]|uniref:Uncharacterized protein n=1 Tax=Ooceraea biroi TaxID=2015173 RepID=A0A026WL81_OOCBI|nr:hypothetical protein X777_03041 [Ooceraea biroi]
MIPTFSTILLFRVSNGAGRHSPLIFMPMRGVDMSRRQFKLSPAKRGATTLSLRSRGM